MFLLPSNGTAVLIADPLTPIFRGMVNFSAVFAFSSTQALVAASLSSSGEPISFKTEPVKFIGAGVLTSN